MKKYQEPKFDVFLITELDVLTISPIDLGVTTGEDPWATDIYQ